MKIQIDGETVLELNKIQEKVIQNDIPSEIFKQDMERRASWVITHKYERCFERLKREWEPILSQRFSSLPTNPDAFAELVFAQTDYKNRSQKEREFKSNLTGN